MSINFHILFYSYILSQIDTYIYIHTIKELRYPREVLQLFAYIPGAMWTIRDLPDRLTFKGHWTYDLHELAEGNRRESKGIEGNRRESKGIEARSF